MRVVLECLHCAMSSALEAVKQAPQEIEPLEPDEDGFASFAEPKLPARLGRFMLLSRLGHGGMGTVYEAEDRELERVVALKLIRSHHFAGPAERQRFKREMLASAKLDDPNTVPVYEAGELDGCPYLTMKLIRGGTLADLLKEGPLPAEKAAGIMAKVAAAVQHAHDRGVLHRDLKPSNILIDEQGEPWLTDFGLARLFMDDHGDTLEGSQIGTPMYMAPEQAAGRTDEVGPATDVWALGVLLYQMLSGKLPYKPGENLAVIHEVITQPPPKLEAATKREEGLAVLVERCLQKEPADRLTGGAGFLAEELKRWLEGEALLSRSHRKRSLMVLSAFVAVVAAVFGGWWMMPVDDYVISTRDGVLMISSRTTENGDLELISSTEPGETRAVAKGRRFRVDGVSQLDESGTLRLAGIRQVVIETGVGKDRVTFRGRLVLDKDARLELRPRMAKEALSEVYIDQRAELRASGQGGISISAGAGIEVDTDALLEVENGPLHLAGNWQGMPKPWAFEGLLIKGRIQSRGTGAIKLQGHGSGEAKRTGVLMLGAQVNAGLPGGTLEIEGEGGEAGHYQIGVSVASGSRVTSMGADVRVRGIGHGSNALNFGVDVRTGGLISAGGAGKVEVMGTGGQGQGGEHHGVHLISGGSIQSAGGAVVVSGTAGDNGVGVRLSDGSIRAGGGGSVQITGIGALGEGEIEDAYGVELRKKPGTLLTTEGGEIGIIGKGGSADAADIWVADGALVTTQEHGGRITLKGEQLSIAPGSVREGVVAGEGPKPDWIVTLKDGELCVLDNADLGGVLIVKEVSPGELGLILAPEAVVQMPDFSRRSGGTFPIPLSGIRQMRFELADGDDRLEFHGFSSEAFPGIRVDAGPGDDLVTFSGKMALAEAQSLDLDLQDDAPVPGADSVVLNPGCQISTRGAGAVIMRVSRKIQLSESSIQTVDGGIILEANQQSDPSTGSFRGVDLIMSRIISEGSGAITLGGRGGTEGNFQFGIKLDKGSLIQGGAMGRVSLTGIGGDNGLNDNSGVCLEDAESQILSRGADIELRGTGMGKPGSGHNYGIALLHGRIAAAGAGNITLIGHGGATLGWENTGILIRGASVTSENGDVALTGHGGGKTGAKGGVSSGVVIHQKGRVTSTGSGRVIMEGSGGQGAAMQHFGVLVRSEAQISSAGGDVKVSGTGGAGGIGVLLGGGASLRSGGRGSLTVSGRAGEGDSCGILLEGAEGTLISTSGGDLLLKGQGGSPKAAGITTEPLARITTAAQGGKVRLVGSNLSLAPDTVDQGAEIRSQP